VHHAIAVSRQIKALEEQLGVPLFQRFHGALELTLAGQKLLTTLRSSFAGWNLVKSRALPVF